MNPFIETIISQDPAIRNTSFHELCKGKSVIELVNSFKRLDEFRRKTTNLYDRVRASIFFYMQDSGFT